MRSAIELLKRTKEEWPGPLQTLHLDERNRLVFAMLHGGRYHVVVLGGVELSKKDTEAIIRDIALEVGKSGQTEMRIDDTEVGRG